MTTHPQGRWRGHWRLRLTGSALLLVMPLIALAADSPRRAVALSAAQRSALIELTCSDAMDSAAIEIQAWRARPPRNNVIEAVLLCPLQQSTLRFPAFRQSYCSQEHARSWVCDETREAFRLPIDGQQVLITYHNSTATADTALEVASLIGLTYGFTFNGRNLRDMMRVAGQCHVEGQGPAVMEGALNYSLHCGNAGVQVTRDCRRRPCRLFPASVYDLDVSNHKAD